MTVRLAELNPHWVAGGGDGVTRNGQPVPRREGVGVMFDCPCGKCGMPCYIPFRNPLDGGPAYDNDRNAWERTGDTFETLTLKPSVLRNTAKGGCGWHGFVTDGAIVSC